MFVADMLLPEEYKIRIFKGVTKTKSEGVKSKSEGVKSKSEGRGSRSGGVISRCVYMVARGRVG